MIGSISAQIGLLTFAVAILAGVSAGNPHDVVLTRALLALVASIFLAQVVGACTKLILRDYLRKKKQAIDQAHADACAADADPNSSHSGSETLNAG